MKTADFVQSPATVKLNGTGKVNPGYYIGSEAS
jgi:hypothetical protein